MSEATEVAVAENKAYHSNVECLHYSEIHVDDRVRSDVGEFKDFADKLYKEGQQNPITYEWREVEGREGLHRVLNTGFRRLASAGWLESQSKFFGMDLPEGNPRRVRGPGYLLARDIGTLSDLERLELELSENTNRKSFNEGEEALGYARLKRLIEKTENRSMRVAELAARIGKSSGQVGMGLKVAEFLESPTISNESKKKIRNSSSVKAAHQTITSDRKLAELRERAKQATIKPEHESAIENSDGVEFLRSLEPESVDFVHMDLPWGIDYDSFQRFDKHEKYNDDREAAIALAKEIIPLAYRCLKQDTWSVFWCGIQYTHEYVVLLESVGFRVDPVPTIWFKPNKGGSQGDATITETNVYECYLRLRKGEPRMFKKPVVNHISCPMDTADEREHSAQKPVDLCRELLERYTFGTMLIVDPTYGSGRVFKAAKILGRQFAGAELSDLNREKAINLLRRMD